MTVLELCMKIIRFEQRVTPAVASFLLTRGDKALVLEAFDHLLRRNAHLNGWQTWWLQQLVGTLPDFAKGSGAKRRRAWAEDALDATQHTPVLRALAALTFARLRLRSAEDLLPVYDRTSAALQSVVVAAVAFAKAGRDIEEAVRGDSPLHRWTYDWVKNGA